MHTAVYWVFASTMMGRGLFEIEMFVHIDVADTVGMAHDRDFRIVHDVLNESVGASGNEKI
ncbi:MAG: hypothetical protein ACOX4J_07630, partial [Anaerovoracaceae bacterium]